MKSISTMLIAVLLSVTFTAAQATQQSTNQPTTPLKPRPALDACNGKNIGASCAFTSRKNMNITGTCRKPPRAHGQVVCLPNPLPQAFDACKGKNVGDACSFTNRRNMQVQGLCKVKSGSKDEMVCKRQSSNK